MANELQSLAEQAYRIAKRKPKNSITLSRTGKKITFRKGALRALAKRAGAWDPKRRRIKVSWLERLKERLMAQTEKGKLTAAQRHLLQMVNLALSFRSWRKVGRRS
ncbi:MAG: hypothetical protein DRP82_01260 [Planctomycetota bacterium]|nr:MAG: hypothetical protein DRP82_01260 [Planctomycetota bacterium]